MSKKLLWGGALSAAILLTHFVLNGPGETVGLNAPDKKTESHKATSNLRRIKAESNDEAASNPVKGTNASVLQQIESSEVVYLAETHNNLADHIAQLEIIKTLDSKGDIAIALEMFQRPFQPVLEAYIAGEISEAELIEQSEYETRWGFDWALYAPIVRYAKENKIPLIALNTPAEVTRKVATEGLESLSGDELTYIPAVADINLDNEAYKAQLQAIFGAHGGAGHSLSFDNFFAAQVLWDETMAERVAQQLTEQPERQVVVLAGEGHVLYGYGIPDRVERRMPNVKHSSVRLVSAEAETDSSATDFVWVTNQP